MRAVIEEARGRLGGLEQVGDAELKAALLGLTGLFNQVIDVEKHYLRKEYLLFPYLERTGVTGPPKVMWGNTMKIRDLLRGSLEVLKTPGITREELLAAREAVLEPAVKVLAEDDHQGRGYSLPDADGFPGRCRLVRMETGNANVLLLLVAQQTYLQAVIAVVQARANRLSDTAALFQALGGGWWNRVAPPTEKILEVGSSTAFTLIDPHGLY